MAYPLGDRWLLGLLADWSSDDVASFSAHLQHFASDLEASLQTTSRRTDR
ncbi:MAG: hypothetical protein K0R30_1731 [Ornithinibacter sp.]|jgi:hypothetical protein|nr:hypothetical protein [Ornithinibacter sp.]